MLKSSLNSNKRKLNYNQKNFRIILIPIFLFVLNINPISNAEEEYSSKEIEMGNSTKSESGNNLDIPSNPFEIVEMIRRANSMNDATKPSDAIDDAIKSFDMIKDKESL